MHLTNQILYSVREQHIPMLRMPHQIEPLCNNEWCLHHCAIAKLLDGLNSCTSTNGHTQYKRSPFPIRQYIGFGNQSFVFGCAIAYLNTNHAHRIGVLHNARLRLYCCAIAKLMNRVHSTQTCTMQATIVEFRTLQHIFWIL